MKAEGLVKKVTALVVAGAVICSSNVAALAEEKVYAEPGKEYTVKSTYELPDLPAGYEWYQVKSEEITEKTCTLPEHEHDASCYESAGDEEGTGEDSQKQDDSSEIEGNEQNQEPQCGYDVHKHDDDCYQTVRVFTYELKEISSAEVGYYLCVDRDHSIPGEGLSDFKSYYISMGSDTFSLDPTSKTPIDEGQIQKAVNEQVAAMQASGQLYKTESIEFVRFQYESGDYSYRWHADFRIVTVGQEPSASTADVTCYIWNAETESYDEFTTVTGLELDGNGTPKFDKDAFINENIKPDEKEKVDYELKNEDGKWSAYFKVLTDDKSDDGSDVTADTDKTAEPAAPVTPATPDTPVVPGSNTDKDDADNTNNNSKDDVDNSNSGADENNDSEDKDSIDITEDRNTDSNNGDNNRIDSDNTGKADTDTNAAANTNNANANNTNAGNANNAANTNTTRNGAGNAAAVTAPAVNAPIVEAENDAEEIEIVDEAVALADGDADDEDAKTPAVTTIEEEAAPLAAAEDNCIIHWIILLLTFICGGYHLVRAFFRKNEEEDEKEVQEA